MDMNQLAHDYLEAYTHGRELPGGWAYGKALRNLQLDYSLDSVARIDAMLYRISSTISPEQLLQDQDKNNTFLLLGFYLGTFIAKRCNQPINWYSRARLPAACDIADGFESQTICLIGERVFMPLKVIYDLLFSNDDEQPNCLQLVDYYCRQQVTTELLNAHEHYCNWMERFFSEQDFPGGLFYRELFKQTFPDFTLDSLARLDQLLQDIRSVQQPSYDELVNQPGGSNFLLFAAYYLSTTIARAGELPLRWLSYEEAKTELPDLKLEFETSRICEIAGRFYFPLGVLTEILFADTPTHSCHSYATEALRQVRRESRPQDIPRPQQPTPIRYILETNPLWMEAMKQAGSLASHGMFMVRGSNQFVPTLLTPTSRGKFFRQLSYSTLDAALEQGIRELDHNPNQLPYQALLYQGYYRSYDQQTDALMLLLRGYQGTALHLNIALPYRHHSHPQGFAIYTPKLLESNVDTELHGELFQLFYQGIDELRMDAFDYAWDKFWIGGE